MTPHSSDAPILYVEDDDNDVLLLQFGLKQAQLSNPLHVAANGRLAIEYLAGTGAFAARDKYPLPGLVLLDLNMPLVSGFEVLEWLRQQPQFQHLPVLVFTASNQEQDRQRASALGATDYLVKPADINRLPALLQEIRDRWLSSQVEPRRANEA